MAYIGAGAFGIQNVLSKAQASLKAAAAKLPAATPGAAGAAVADARPWHMRPATWLLGGALALGVYFMLKPGAMRANPYPPPGKRTHCRHCDQPTRSLSPDGYCGHCMLPSEDTPPAPVRVSVRPRRRRSR